MSWKFTLFTFVLFTLSAWQLSGQSCGDFFYDSGGPNGQYQNNENQTWTFCPDNPGDLVTLNFTFVNIESGWDFLAVYSGSGTTDPLNTNILVPASFTSGSSDGCLTVTFSSDGSVMRDGWEALVTCAPPPPCPNPTQLAVSNVNLLGATFSWSQVGNVTTWDIEIVPAGTPSSGTPSISDITDNPYVWTGGESGTAYDFYVRGHCEEEGEFTNWVGPASFTTASGCGDSFFDSGGPNGQYQNNELETYIFCPDNPGDIVTLDFTLVDIAINGDELSVFSGIGTDLPLLIDLENPVSFSSVSEDGCLTVVWTSNGFTTDNGWEADIICAPPPVCAPPFLLSVSQITSSTALLDWFQAGGIGSWDIEVVESGSMQAGTPTFPGVTEVPYTVTGLISGTNYDFYVRGQCGNGDFTSWIGPVSGTTVPGCGDSFFDSGGPDGQYQNNEDETYLFCPDNPGDLVTLNFIFVDIESGFDNLAVYSGTGTDFPLNTNVLAPESFTSLDADGCITVTWSTDGSVTRDGWEAIVSCAPPPPCANPSFLTVDGATTNGAVISWAQVGNVSVWDLEFVLSGAMPTGIPTVTDVTDNPYTWAGGESGTTYDVYVRGHCEDEGEFSNWVGPVSFTTIPGCGDSFFDPGGPDGEFMNNTSETYIFCPENPGEAVVLDFTFVELFGDVLAVYNGQGTDDVLNANVIQPGLFASTAADGCLTVTFNANAFGTAAGWEASVNCSPCTLGDNLILTPDVSVTFFDASTATILIDQAGLDTFMIEYDTVGFEIGTGATVMSDDSLVTLTNLPEGTDFEFYVSNLCPDGQASIVLGPFTFSTIFFNDVGITNLVAPTDECGLGDGEPIRVSITNFGQSPQTLFPLNFSINGNPSGVNQPVDGFFTGIVSRDSTETFEFDLNYDFDLPGEYTIQVWTEMMNDSDVSNDTFTIVVTRFAPPLFEDFEAGVIPDYITTSPATNLYAPFAHNNESFVVGANLFGTFNELIVDLPVLGPIQDTDTLFFDYRYVDWFAGTAATTDLTGTDLLSVLVSIDCGETFGIAFLQAGTDHEPSVDFRTVSVPLAPYAGENLQIRIAGTYGSGGPDYWLDIDNINLPRCDGLGITAEIIDTNPGLDDGTITATPASGIAPFEFLWSTGETTETITDLPPGDYSVTITDRFGCTDELTVTVDIIIGTEEVVEVIGDISLAPNPTQGQSQVRAAFRQPVDARVELINLLGQRIWQGPTLERVTTLNETVDLSQVPAGIYLIRIQAAGQTKMVKLMKS